MPRVQPRGALGGAAAHSRHVKVMKLLEWQAVEDLKSRLGALYLGDRDGPAELHHWDSVRRTDWR